MCGEENKRRDSIEKILNTEASAIKGTHRYLDIGLHSSFMEKILPGTKRPRCTSIFHSAINPTSRSNKLNEQINREQNFPPNKPLPRLKITHRRMKLDGKRGGGGTCEESLRFQSKVVREKINFCWYRSLKISLP